MSRRGHGLIAAGVLTAAGAAAAMLTGGSSVPSSAAQPPEVRGNRIVAGEGVCDVDGVTAGYQVGFHEGDVDEPGFYVEVVNLGELDDNCELATATVDLLDEVGNVLATGTEEVPLESGGTANVPLDSLASARDVVRIDVELQGGSLPIPEECEGMTFDHVIVGEPGPDTLRAPSGASRTIILGLSGDDTITGGNGADCLDGGPGNDTVEGRNQHDVLIGGAGGDTLFAGNGNDRLYGDADDVRIDGGSGNDRCEGGTTATRFSCEGMP